MPVFVLYIKAELENIASLSIPSDAQFCLDVKESAGDEVKEGVYISSTEVHEMHGSKGTANLVMKFAKGSKKEASASVVEVKGLTRAVTADDDRQWVPIIAFECRGLDPVKFTPQSSWAVTSSGGTKWSDVDLSEGEWNEYCEKAGEAVGITALEHKFQVHRG